MKSRLDFYDDLAKNISIPDVVAERKHAYDDEKGQNGGIILKYDSRFPPLKGLKTEVLLEVGFTRTAPNEPCNFGSWALERALSRNIGIIDNRALGVLCFLPEYTMVDKLQTICRRFRQHRDRKDVQRDRPREFLRHYYDLYRLLGLERVQRFIGTPEYEVYKKEKLRSKDLEEFETLEAFSLPKRETYDLFKKEFDSMNTLLLGPAPAFEEVMEGIGKYLSRF